MARLSCIRDVPIHFKKHSDKNQSINEIDTLNAFRYAEALSKFIRNADTLVTIGIQGGWGSGKTSLFSIIQEDLYRGENPPLCITVNAWEHSLFQERQEKSMVVLSILTSILDSIQEEVKRSDFDNDGKNFIETKLAPTIKKTFQILGKYMPSLVGAALGIVSGTSTQVEKGADAESQQFPRLADQIRELRQSIGTLVNNIRKNGQPIKTVIFIDDLDRVHPATAVEILDVIKNIFNIENCIFVLAIDYEVVVKGLESKFGKRTEENEREFREYFDKIIQVPFSMPIGSYSRELGHLLVSAFASLEIYQDYKFSDDILKRLAQIAKLATGGNPRSIKRLLNTLSLLQYIPDELEESLSYQDKLRFLQIRFIIVALHLNFPEISRALMGNNKFTSWKLKELAATWNLNLEKSVKDLDILKNSQELREYFDEEWEQVIFCLCAKSEWLKRKVWNVSQLFNTLRYILNRLGSKEEDTDENLAATELSDKAMESLAHVLSSIAVVSIDSSINDGKEKLKYDVISRNLKALQHELASRHLSGIIGEPRSTSYAAQHAIDETRRIYSMETKSGDVTGIKLSFQDDDEPEMEARFTIHNNCKDQEHVKAILTNLLNSEASEIIVSSNYSEDACTPEFSLMFQWDLSKKELEETEKLSKKIADLYKIALETAKQINHA